MLYLYLLLEIFLNSLESKTATTDTATNATHSHSLSVASNLVYCYFRNRRRAGGTYYTSCSSCFGSFVSYPLIQAGNSMRQ